MSDQDRVIRRLEDLLWADLGSFWVERLPNRKVPGEGLCCVFSVGLYYPHRRPNKRREPQMRQHCIGIDAVMKADLDGNLIDLARTMAAEIRRKANLPGTLTE